MNRIFRKIFPILAVVSALMAAVACSDVAKLNQIKISSVNVRSVVPQGFTSLKAEIDVTVDNPSLAFTLSDISGIVYYDGKALVDYTAEPVMIPRHSLECHTVTCNAKLSSGVAIRDLLALTKSYDVNLLSADIHVRVTLNNGISKAVDLKRIPLKSFME